MLTFVRSAVPLLAAGALATIAFDLVGLGLAPFLGYPALSPVPWAGQALRAVLSEVPAGAAQALHALTGLVLHPLAYLLVARPLAHRLAGPLPWVVAAAVFGLAIWAVAVYGVAHLLAGAPAFLGFTDAAWVALGGHVAYAVVLAWALGRRL